MSKWDTHIEVLSHGPALGTGYTLALGESFFVVANLSILYMRGKMTLDQTVYHYDGSTGIDLPIDDERLVDEDTVHIGVNFEPSIGVSVESKLIITLGARYQWLSTEIVEPDIEVLEGTFNDHLYGIFVSALYLFSL